MKKLLFLIILIIGSSSIFAQQKGEIHWLTFEQLADSLAAKPKKVLLFFHTDWCGYCRKMQQEVFTDQSIIDKTNADYYAVQFDAESTETVHFDHHTFTNPNSHKKSGSYHQLTTILATQKNRYVFPTTILLDADFRVQARYFEYIGRDKLKHIL